MIGVAKINPDGSKEPYDDSGDLWWALRGGGPGLGVVVSYKLKMHDPPTGFVQYLAQYPME